MLKNEFEMKAQQLTKAEKRKHPKDKSTRRLDKNLEIRGESAAGARAQLNSSTDWIFFLFQTEYILDIRC